MDSLKRIIIIALVLTMVVALLMSIKAKIDTALHDQIQGTVEIIKANNAKVGAQVSRALESL